MTILIKQQMVLIHWQFINSALEKTFIHTSISSLLLLLFAVKMTMKICFYLSFCNFFLRRPPQTFKPIIGPLFLVLSPSLALPCSHRKPLVTIFIQPALQECYSLQINTLFFSTWNLKNDPGSRCVFCVTILTQWRHVVLGPVILLDTEWWWY